MIYLSLQAYMKLFKISLLGACIVPLVACQTTSQRSVSSQDLSRQERPLKLSVSQDGLQDITWQITHIAGQAARSYRQMPTLKLHSQGQRLEGHTGCNVMQGRYSLNHSQKSLTLDAKAGHQSCDQALAQEAELAQALARVARYQLSNRQLILLDQAGHSLVVAKK